MRRLNALCGLSALLLTACFADTPATNRISPPEPAATPVDVAVDPGTDVDLRPKPEVPEAPNRERRRMDLDQLDAAIRSVSGGIGWTETRSGREVNLFTDLAQTLGKPDYLQITEEDLQPSAMFQKFLDDAARSVCDKLMVSETNRPSSERVFFVHASMTDSLQDNGAKVVENLQYLLLRFHGRKVGPEAGELEAWRWLLKSAEHVTDDQPEVWRTLCVGLITHPDFYTY